jgi:alanyl aminopeptidase
MSRRLSCLALACLCLASCVAPRSGTPTDATHGELRLDDSVLPRAYELVLAIDPSRERFSGEARIDIEIARPVDAIVLHGRDLDVREAAVILADGTRRPVRYAESAGVARLTPEETIPPQRATLELHYTAPFAAGLVGLYRMSSSGRDYAATLFEAIDARRAFPGFDEPRFKTPFTVVLDVPAPLTAIANTEPVETLHLENGRKRVRFAPTPPLPTYLVAFAVGPWAADEGAPIAPAAIARPAIPLRFLAPQGMERGLAHARVPTARLLQALERYFDIAYPYPKLDVVAIPEFDAGAMENVGAISFDSDVIVLEDPVPAEKERQFAMVMAHELAHQWVGNLVTMPWWDDLWLSEAFATWISHRIVQETYPRHDALLGRLPDLRAAIAEDGLVSARSIREPIRTEHDIENAFDDITYDKGGAVLTMVERWVGPEVFRDALHAHLERFAHATADAYDLMDSLERVSGKPVRAVLSSFIEQPGIPQVDVRPVCDGRRARVELEQSRYRPLGSRIAETGRWEIPACLRYSAGGTIAERCLLLADQRLVIDLDTCPDWLLPNADFAGYYHWSLPAEWYGYLDAVIDELPAEEGLAIADSIEAAFAAGRMEAGDAIRAMQPLARARHPVVALAPVPFYTTLVERLVAGTSAEAAARADAATLYPHDWAALAFDPDASAALPSDAERLRRADAAVFLARTARVASVRAEGVARARAWLEDEGAVATDMLETALEVAVQDGDAALFDALLARLGRSVGAERAIILSALARASSPERARRMRELALGPAIDDDERRTLLVEQSAVTGNVEAAWAWLQAHFDELARSMPSNHAAGLPAVADAFCDRTRAREVEAFFAPRIDAYVGGPRNLAQAVERIELCAALRDRHAQAARAYFTSRAVTASHES